MTRRSRKNVKPESPPPAFKLPPFGLAEDILKGDGTVVQLPPAEAETTPTGPDRIFAFADSLKQMQPEVKKTEEPLETWITFTLARETFALPITHVREILRVECITRVPHAPAPVRGVTNLRGRILPVVDLRTRIGLLGREVDGQSRIVVISASSRIIGLLVDGVEQVVRIPMNAVLPPPPDIMTDQSHYLRGIYHGPGGMVILLDVNTVLLLNESPAPQEPDRPGIGGTSTEE